MSDPWLPERLRAAEGLARHEQGLITRVFQIISEWLKRLRSAVQPEPGVINPAGAFAATPYLQAELDDTFEVEIREIVDAAHDDVTDDGMEPEAERFTLDYLRTARNRVTGAPARVYADIRGLVAKAATEGWSIQELAAEVGEVIGDAGLPMWRNRATVIARTEALSAYNAGTFAGFLSMAKQLGGRWEKGWLGTAELMFPGDPRGPAHEVIQCRCSLILLRPGETINAANRQYRESA